MNIKACFKKHHSLIFYQILIAFQDRKRTMPAPNDTLEEAYKSKAKIGQEEITELSKKTDLDRRQVERWFRHRSLVNKASKLDKFCESAWKALFYTSMYT